MKELLNKVFIYTKDPEISGTIFITIGLMMGNFFSYLLQIFLARFLSIEDYGAFNALLAVSYLIGVPGGVFVTSIIKIISELSSKEDYKKITWLFVNLFGISALIGLFVSFMIVIFKTVISSELRIGSSEVIIYYAVFAGLSFLTIVPRAYLTGLLRYKGFAFYTTVTNLFRFILPAFLVYLGYKLYGVFIGFSIVMILGLILSLFILKKNFTKIHKHNLRDYYRKILAFSVPVLLINLGMNLLNNIDVILVKKYFEPETAGYYAGVVTLGKILLFGAGGVIIVMFPKIAALYSSKKDFKTEFKRLFVFQSLLAGIGIFAFAVFPKFFTLLFFGHRFSYAIKYLPLFTVFMGLYILINFFVTYFLAIEKTRVYLFMFPVVLLQFMLINLYHSDLFDVININIFVSTILLIFLLLYYWRSDRQGQKIKLPVR